MAASPAVIIMNSICVAARLRLHFAGYESFVVKARTWRAVTGLMMRSWVVPQVLNSGGRCSQS